MGGCVFNDIEYEEKYREQEAEDSREIKLIIVDLLEQVLLDDEKKSSNFTSVIRRLRHLSTSSTNFNEDNPKIEVKYCISSLSGKVDFF